jgi:AcrR family transcriptional regulator
VPTVLESKAPPQEVDGRNQRRLNSFERAVDALLDLIECGNPAPTAEEIAEHSGISVRTVFRLTEDIESLHAAAVTRQMERTARLYVILPSGGPLATRVRALVKNRCAVFEAIAPVRRVGVRLMEGSPQIAEGLRQHHLMLREQVESVFTLELTEMPRARREVALDALDVASSFETWEQLRRIKSLSVGESSRVMRLLVEATVGTLGVTGSKTPG